MTPRGGPPPEQSRPTTARPPPPRDGAAAAAPARVGRRALVLAPNSAVQMQWMRTVRAFTDDARLVATDPASPGWELLCLTYQSLAQLDDPEVALGRLAAARWADERAAASSRGSAPRSSARSPRAATRASGSPTCSPSPRASACAGSPPRRSARS